MGKEKDRATGKESEESEAIAAKVKYLFEHYRKPGGEKYTFTEVEEATGGTVHNSWLSKLASGRASRPGLPTLKALTNFFQIDPGFWFKSLDEWIREQAEAQNNIEAQAREIAVRMREMSPQARQFVLDMLDSVERRFERGDEDI